ncbi:ABC transporter ATP-binding protein [Anaerosporobacter faecicola]|uniref:ABC transporter ATP-binding protein n=1 Tax=Anaerosporobacter faecicola TaxID=2718714 RepID=UPI00143BDE82|nr:ABC transporter ATP-binding protein [Anaerosporobacter faecicola]
MHTVKTINLSKSIKKSELIVNVNMELEGGTIYGLVGENGSGKTMLFRMLSGLVSPTSGRIYFDGEEVSRSNKPNIGVMIENASLFPEFTAYQNLSYLAGIKKIVGKEDIIQTIGKVGLDPYSKKTYKKFSLGMKQRLLLAQAIMESPDYLFLDEPTNAIDQEGIQVMHNVIREQADRGTVVLIASHNKSDISQLCTLTFRMEQGRIEREE